MTAVRALGPAVLAAFLAVAPALAQNREPWTGPGIPARSAASTEPGSASAAARAVTVVGLTVSDMARSIDFYTRVLDFERVSDVEVADPAYAQLEGVPGARARVVRLRLGDESLELTAYTAPAGRPGPADARSNDRWFQHVAIIVSDMDRAYARIREHHVQPTSSAPQLLPKTIPNAAGIRAFYFRDPDGHPLEILQFPPDKGNSKWQRADGRLFLGIDHTAIVVKSTAASLAFYRDALGFRVAGGSLNFGTEQEHLNNVPGARLRITSLRAAQGPGVEFLEYLTPRDGRPYPANEHANDLVHWQTTVLVPDAATAAAVVRRGRFRLVSPGPVELPDTALGFQRGLMVRDPDGHAVQLIQAP
ncbi:MAG TPA: VOC family protein [Gemmatimonadales bacterium]|nr:VOC family protein [Gemmatimonadales bacterium]